MTKEKEDEVRDLVDALSGEVFNLTEDGARTLQELHHALGLTLVLWEGCSNG
jgi:hypothetical protein